MSWRKRGYRRNRSDDEDSSWGDIDSLFDFDMRFGFENIDQMIERMFRVARSAPSESANASGPIYYGYSIVTGPDGKPHVRQFGNVKPTSKGTFERSSREPFVDTVVDEKENKLKIIAEMPGVQREDIKLEVLEDSLKIRAERSDKQYETTVPFKVPIDPQSASATYNNGILEVNLKMRAQPQPKGVSVRVD